MAHNRVRRISASVTAVLVLAGCGACSQSTKAADGSAGGSGGDIHGAAAPRDAATGAGGAEPAMPPETVAGDGRGEKPAPPDGHETQPNARVGLTAGSVDDNAEFADYLQYQRNFSSLGQEVHAFDVTQRHIFVVRDASGLPVLGADIVIEDAGDTIAELRTDSAGKALWFPQGAGQGGDQYDVTVAKGNVTTHADIDVATDTYPITLDAPATSAPVPLDVEFVVDATGSMGDEIAQLKASLSDIADRIDAMPARPDVRFALTIYRDRHDAFLTRTWNFSSDVNSFEGEIAGVYAEGGGDYPEDVQQGLYDALHKPDWRPDAVKLMILIGDAPPHLDYANDPDYIATAQDAARMGVKIESLAASGLDDVGEYVWRQLAEITQGEFLFLTYGPQGGPGTHTDHHVSGYQVMNLEDLVVELVAHELAPLSQQQSTGQGAGS